jgi:trehalose 6-phosphate synthase/phosphatase
VSNDVIIRLALKKEDFFIIATGINSSKEPMTSLTPVTFRVQAYTGPGEVVCVVGNARNLGNMQIERAVQLVTSPYDFPTWYNPTPIFLLAGSEVKYRYAIFSGGVFSRFEAPPGAYRPSSGSLGGLVSTTGVAGDNASASSSSMAASTSSAITEGDDNYLRSFVVPVNVKTAFELTDVLSDVSTTPSAIQFAIPVMVGGKESPLNDQVVSSATRSPPPDLLKKGIAKGSTTTGVVNTTPKAAAAARRAARWKKRMSGDESKAALSEANKKRLGALSKKLNADRPGASVIIRDENSASSNSDDESVDENQLESQRGGILIANYFLPVVLTRTVIGEGGPVVWKAQWDPNELLSTKGEEDVRISYVGFPRTENPIPIEEQELVSEAVGKLHCYPVFLDEELHQRAYYGYAIGTLYELFHGVVDVLGPRPTRLWDRASHEETWHSFSNVNRRFVEKIVEAYNDGDVIWIHGIELILLPSFTSRRLLSSHPSIGYFLHSPFPSSEIFRTLSVREDLLRGMLGADHIGFHIFEHVRHFLTCCKRILGLATEPGAKGAAGLLNVVYQGRLVNVTTCHAGVDPKFIRKHLAQADIHEASVKLRERVFATSPPTDDSAKQILISCVDDATRLQGAFFQLLALESFLDQNEIYRGSVRFVQYTVLIPHLSEASQKSVDDCQIIVERINAKYPGVIIFELRKKPVSLDERLALWAASDILFRIPIREGLCLYPFEFILAAAPRKPLMILSDFAADCRDLVGSYRANPMRIDEMVKALVQCLTASNEERNVRFAKDLNFVNTHTVYEWAKHVLTDIRRAHESNTDEGKELSYTTLGLGLGFRSIGFRPNFSRLSDDDVVRAYRSSANRLFLLDYGGTTVRDEVAQAPACAAIMTGGEPSPTESSTPPNTAAPEMFLSPNSVTSTLSNFKTSRTGFVQVAPSMPSNSLIRSLQVLCADPRNTVFIVSGRERVELEQAFGTAPVLSLVAEHGFYYSWGSSTPYARKEKEFGRQKVKEDGKLDENHPREWEMLGDHFDESWKDIVESIMKIYTMRTNGTYIEHKGNTMLWQYRDAETEFGTMQAQELRDHLDGVLKNFPVSVELGKTYVEVRPSGCDKGSAAQHIIQALESAGTPPDFILAMGDDVADERMFNALDEILPRLQNAVLPAQFGKKIGETTTTDKQQQQHALRMFTCVVGKKPSAAKNFLNDVDDVEIMLSALAKASVKDSRSVSLVDLRVLDIYSGSIAQPETIHEGAEEAEDSAMEAEDDANISNFIRDATKFTIPQRPTTRTPKTPPAPSSSPIAAVAAVRHPATSAVVVALSFSPNPSMKSQDF